MATGFFAFYKYNQYYSKKVSTSVVSITFLVRLPDFGKKPLRITLREPQGDIF
ncbi:hypothetical protein Pedsa_0570 [Pseudopedobacter saltans DSM 12145]|uniref:Uncharacterized protein n=1 Tax=Pseudopedobacter saltans (strain ATCC 51119 / DSM 12145 / JCM 21818 / CCUG 39354 / LMG 10337 / NBRC 100064 / NCIMB 13643) TaxID=762903 RepID=F0S7C4_PSESL|nr:hypothetical protein Pedsa_0570 [Pseudopedobacter saltans DSM 12145]